MSWGHFERRERSSSLISLTEPSISTAQVPQSARPPQFAYTVGCNYANGFTETVR